jgi:hypothetical protein
MNSIFLTKFLQFPLMFIRFLNRKNQEPLHRYKISDISLENYSFELQIVGSRACFWNDPFEVINNAHIVFNCIPEDLIVIGKLHAKSLYLKANSNILKYKFLKGFCTNDDFSMYQNKYSLFVENNPTSNNRNQFSIMIKDTNKRLKLNYDDIINNKFLLDKIFPPDLIRIGFSSQYEI